MGVLILYIEVFGQPLTVVGGDEVLDDARQVVFVGKFQSLGDVADDDGGTLLLGEFVVRIEASLILGEERRIGHLSDVVIERTGTHELGFRPDFIGYLRGKVADGYAVLECSRSDLAELTEQRVVGVRELEECDSGNESEGLLDDKHKRIGEEKEESVDGKMIVHRRVELCQ